MSKSRRVSVIVVGLGLCSCALKPTDRIQRPMDEAFPEVQRDVPIDYPRSAPKQPPESKSYIVSPKPMAMLEAVRHLMSDASGLSRRGDTDAAITTVERALRIQPRNAELWHQLASFRLQQDQPGSAESLAKKSNSLAGEDVNLKRKNWTLIGIARRRLGDEEGAYRAEWKADQY